MYTPIYPSSYRHSPWPSPMRLSRPIFNDWLNLADKRIVEYTCMARNLSKSNDSSRMDGGWEVSESLVTCSPCSRIGCHVPMERATWAFPFPISPFILSGLFPSLFYIYIHLCVWYMCVYSLSLSLPFPSCLHLAVSHTRLPAGAKRTWNRWVSSSPLPYLLPHKLPVLSRFRTTSIMSVYSLSTEPRCLWQRMNSNLNMYCRRQINIYSRDRALPSAEPPRAPYRSFFAYHLFVTFPPRLPSSLRSAPLRAQCFSTAASKCNLIMSAAADATGASSGSSWFNDAE